jgi:AraC family transcriptional regulator, regulatory protein of adaptative response / methylated-DNA-[protein]-cysteine methyltransferase
MPRRSTPPRNNVAAVPDGTRWATVVARIARLDGRLVYSVATTGVYCQPSCPARLAKRANVRFHATPADAEAAGFRPCKRCKPAGERSPWETA